MKPKIGEFSEEWILSTAQQQYAEGRATISVDPGRTALIIVDMIDEFVKPNWCPYWVPEATRQVPRIKTLIDSFHGAKLPVIFLAYEGGLRGLNFPTTEWVVPIGADVMEYAHDIMQRVAIYEDIAPQGDDLVILKHCFSGFHGTELDLVLRALDVSTVVICGTMTNFCCSSTAREAFWHGYKVIFGSDVNSTDDPAIQDAELKTLRRGFARVMSADEIIAEIESVTQPTGQEQGVLQPSGVRG
jgi:nicotinamidase-related amidase